MTGSALLSDSIKTIYGVPGSVAQEFAGQFSLEFVPEQ